MSIKNIKEFERHHAFILVFLFVASIFAINVYAFTNAYDRVERADSRNTQPPRIDRELIYPSDEPEPAIVIDNSQELDGLLPALEKHIADSGVNYAIVITDLSNDEQIAVNENTTYVSASLYKLFVAYEVVRRADLGLISIEEPTGHDAGDTSLKDCIYKSLSYSDNDCGRALRKYIGASDSPINSVADAGFYSTSLINQYPTTNAHDVSLFFEKLYDQSDFSGARNDVLLDPLKAQEIDNRLPEGIPEGTPIAHKTADLDGYSHDAGIVYSPNGDYIITVLSGPWANGYDDAPQDIQKLSKLVYNWFNQTNDPTY